MKRILFGLCLCSAALPVPARADLGTPAAVLLLKSQVDEMLKAANHAVETFAKESAAWRKAIDETHDKLKATGQELLAKDLREFSRRVLNDAGVEFRFNLDYTEAKARRYLVAFRDAIGKAQNKLLLVADLKTAQEIVAKMVVEVDAEMAPLVASFSPSVLNIGWKDRATPAAEKVPAGYIWFTGAALRPKKPGDLKLVVVGADGKVRRDVSAHLTIHTPYTASIDLSGTGLGFKATDSDDCLIRLTHAGETIGQVKLQWAERPEKLPALKNIRAVLHTQSHKEAAGQVELTYYHKQRKLADSLHAQEIGIIGNLKHKFNGHIGAYQTWEKGATTGFTPPGGLAFQPDYMAGDEFKAAIALGAVPNERNINWRGDIEFYVQLDDGREVKLGASGGFWFRNNAVEDPQHLRGNRAIDIVLKLPPLPPAPKK